MPNRGQKKTKQPKTVESVQRRKAIRTLRFVATMIRLKSANTIDTPKSRSARISFQNSLQENREHITPKD